MCEVLGTFAVATGLGVASSLLSSAQTKDICDSGSTRSCQWSSTTTGAGWVANIGGRFFPFIGSVFGAATSASGLFNPFFGA
jgi:hypothetical protein